MSYLDKLHSISTFIFDVDGVFTDSLLHISEDGTLQRRMNTRDGFAVKVALEKGYKIIIITGGKSEGVRKRLHNLGVRDIHLGARNKREVLDDLVDLHDLELDRSLYMGDDLPDYDCMRLVHLAVCPNDAAPEIQRISHFVSPIEGGKGCVRDIIERVLKVQGQWNFEHEDV